mgnify:CR=1 FL=1
MDGVQEVLSGWRAVCKLESSARTGNHKGCVVQAARAIVRGSTM